MSWNFHGTYYPSFTTDVNGQSVDVKAKPPRNVKFDGIAANAGLVWRWGQ